MPDHSYLYHSFPRPADRTSAPDIPKGLKILRSIISHGLLLTPEEIRWRNPAAKDPIKGETRAIQRRACFTEIPPERLSEHSVRFGPFAIEFEIGQLRKLGALPVLYVPTAFQSREALEGLGAELIGGLADVTRLVETLRLLSEEIGKRPTIGLTLNDSKVASLDIAETEGVRKLLAALPSAEIAALGEMSAKLRTLSSCFYLVDDPRYTEELGYYLQREWRIVGGFSFQGMVITPATSEQQKELLEIDPVFFGQKRLEFFDQSDAVGKVVEDVRAPRSHFYSRLNGRHFLAYARRVLLPKNLANREVEDIQARLGKIGLSAKAKAPEPEEGNIIAIEIS